MTTTRTAADYRNMHLKIKAHALLRAISKRLKKPMTDVVEGLATGTIRVTCGKSPDIILDAQSLLLDVEGVV